jgi:prevent-host-death family protein
MHSRIVQGSAGRSPPRWQQRSTAESAPPEPLTCSRTQCKVHYMKTVSVRELQQNIKHVIDQVEHGQIVAVTRRRRVVARLMPVRAASKRVAWPDLEKRARAVLGPGTVEPAPSEQVARDRGRW